MKGLLIKDLKLIKKQNRILAITALLCAWFFITDRDASAISAYIAAMVSIIAVGTVNYDEFDNGMGFLFTFPISRRSYVLEKYVFGILLMAVVCIAGSALVFAQAMLKHKPYDAATGFTALLVPVITMSLILSVSLPIQLKYGAENSRAVLLLVGVCAAVIIYGAQQMAKVFAIDFSGVKERIVQASITEVAVCICVLSVAMLGSSYWISVMIMKGKQF